MRFLYPKHNKENMRLKSNTRPTATKAQEKLNSLIKASLLLKSKEGPAARPIVTMAQESSRKPNGRHSYTKAQKGAQITWKLGKDFPSNRNNNH